MKKFLSIILSLLFFFLSSNVDARKRRHHSYRKRPTVQKVINMEGVCGIDVSHYQGTIDWDNVNYYGDNKIQFVYIKATEGSTIKDEYYERNIQQAKQKGLLVGSYHYFTTRSSADEQLSNFMQSITKEHQDLIPVVDIEECEHWPPEVFHRHFQNFLDQLEAYYGQKPIIYTMSFFYNLYLAEHYTDYKIFVAQYGGKPLLRDGNNWEIWQYSRKGRVNGIRGNVDLNVINPDCNLNDLLLINNQKPQEEVTKRELKPNALPL